MDLTVRVALPPGAGSAIGQLRTNLARYYTKVDGPAPLGVPRPAHLEESTMTRLLSLTIIGAWH